MPAPEASTIIDEHPDCQGTFPLARSGAGDRIAHRVSSVQPRPRICWLSKPLNGACCNPGCEGAATTVVGWTLADSRDDRSGGFWCALCFLALLELAGALGIPVEMPHPAA